MKSFLYDHQESGINATLLFNRIGERIYLIGDVGIGATSPDVYEAPRSVVDLQVAKKVLKTKGELRLNISDILKNNLLQFIKGGGHLLIIPAKNIEISSYNSFLKIFNKGSIKKNHSDTLKITDINFEHPIFNNVFSKKVTNFQYPFVTQFYNHNFSGSTILSFQNKSSFLKEINNSFSKIYFFSSPLDKKSTNFFNSILYFILFFNTCPNTLYKWI